MATQPCRPFLVFGAILVMAVLGACATGRGGATATSRSSSLGTSTTASSASATSTTAAASASTAPPPTSTSTKATASAAPTGTLEVVVRDGRGQPRPGVPLEATGPIRQKFVSGEGGVARAVLPSGQYAVAAVVGCGDALEVTSSGQGAADVAADQVARGQLSIEWRRRFVPADGQYPSDWAPADGSPGPSTTSPSWHAGTPYRITYSVIDRCNGNALAPDASMAGWRATTSSNVSIVDEGSHRSDQSGVASFVAQCSGSGPIRVSIADSENPDEPSVDLIARSQRANFGRPTCSAS